MKDIRILDVTLRDGGIVNNFNFGDSNMQALLNSLENIGVKYIELGYLEKNKGTESGRSQFINEKAIRNNFLKNKKPGVNYLAMFDYSKFDPESLEDRCDSGIDGIRFAFHKRNYKEALPIYQKLIDKGYDVYMQPMVTLLYNEDELAALIDEANKLDIKGIYFVDTFGQMLPSDIKRLARFFDERLRKDIALGFHAHNNIEMSFANAITFIGCDLDRTIMLDASILGMGRGAGNLKEELILSYLNDEFKSGYDLKPLLDVYDKVISVIHGANTAWGYSMEYWLSSKNDCSPIYAKHYYEEHNMSTKDINEILKMVEGEKRISFDKAYADDIYNKYMNK